MRRETWPCIVYINQLSAVQIALGPKAVWKVQKEVLKGQSAWWIFQESCVSGDNEKSDKKINKDHWWSIYD